MTEYSIRRSDNYNWVIERSGIYKEGKRKGETWFKVMGHYPKLEQAATALVDILVGGAQVDDMKALVEELESIKAEVIEEVRRCES